MYKKNEVPLYKDNSKNYIESSWHKITELNGCLMYTNLNN